ncbi:hypothetical protein [Ammoniphilus resinae]|uniref:Uncharacterized protein n=1 Tax=Ammoniphilus resinae TaxID=861532 RepID=A0ABS4GXE0_9BACL|nr:hypothetical protein [Ammoniphilus resinae]MBP1934933.1 hypothetical protein [Ammoniphilus resinae]
MGLMGKLFGGKDKELLLNQENLYQKFLWNLQENPNNEHLRQLTIDAGKSYYSLLNKGTFTAEDEAKIQEDLKKVELKQIEKPGNQHA